MVMADFRKASLTMPFVFFVDMTRYTSSMFLSLPSQSLHRCAPNRPSPFCSARAAQDPFCCSSSPSRLDTEAIGACIGKDVA